MLCCAFFVFLAVARGQKEDCASGSELRAVREILIALIRVTQRRINRGFVRKKFERGRARESRDNGTVPGFIGAKLISLMFVCMRWVY